MTASCQHVPFARAQFGRACAFLGACGDVSHTQGGQGVLLLALVGQGGGAQVEDQVQAVQQAPGPQQLEVLVVLRPDTEWTLITIGSVLTHNKTIIIDVMYHSIII